MSSELLFSLEKVTVHTSGVKEIEGEAMAGTGILHHTLTFIGRMYGGKVSKLVLWRSPGLAVAAEVVDPYLDKKVKTRWARARTLKPRGQRRSAGGAGCACQRGRRGLRMRSCSAGVSEVAEAAGNPNRTDAGERTLCGDAEAAEVTLS